MASTQQLIETAVRRFQQELPALAKLKLAFQLELVNPPFQLASDTVRPVEAPPLLGQHTDEVLRELGLDQAEIDRLAEAGVIERA